LLLPSRRTYHGLFGIKDRNIGPISGLFQSSF
jgi:hypothetical protein